MFFNQRHSGHGNWWWCWGVAAACLVAAVAICATTSPAARAALGLPSLVTTAEAAPTAAADVPAAAVQDVVMGRCSMCHMAEPVYEGIAIAPRGILLDTPEAIARNKPLILMQAVLTHAMPPNNVTDISPEDRAVLKAWRRRPDPHAAGLTCRADGGMPPRNQRKRCHMISLDVARLRALIAERADAQAAFLAELGEGALRQSARRLRPPRGALRRNCWKASLRGGTPYGAGPSGARRRAWSRSPTSSCAIASATGRSSR